MAEEETISNSQEQPDSFTPDDLGTQDRQTQDTTQQTGEQASPEPQEFTIPEKFLGPDGQPDYDKLAKSYVELEKAHGRTNNELGNRRAREAQLEAQLRQIQSGQQAGPQPSPNTQGQDATDLNTQFWDQPVSVINQIIEQRDSQHKAQQQRELMGRAQQTVAVAQSEMQQIAFEDNAQMDQDRAAFILNKLDADPDLTSKLVNGSLTQMDVKNAVRKYDKEARSDSKARIDSRLKELGIDPETIKAYEKARKSGAVSPDGNLPANRNTKAGPATDLFSHVESPQDKEYLKKAYDDLFS